MTRTFVIAILLGSGLLAASPGCSEQGVGDPCTPEQEYDATFNGFDEKEVNVESKSFQCRTRVCLVNHFRGRVSCPYGQNAKGDAPTGAAACSVPGTDTKITGPLDPQGNPKDPIKASAVPAQCVDRTADKAVYCSCRCADINGNKPGDQTFCDCPDGFACTPLVTSIGQGNEGLTGSYCIKTGTQYDVNTACNQGECDPTTKKCD
ncbi:hypothetical protein AKJ09_06639 [Labilithrix luteola]|uniref:MEGF11 protein n=1 Tax=Labilithrix luteola TaxID=1391654 RepID=A0A0K1Q2D6_9BACT|nr:hypothetical protein [Labilithrix luteola]AKU99975.1 hypothetical protein AKJ09_06639 [Labilithrix luteola]